MIPSPDPVQRRLRVAYRAGRTERGYRSLAEETPVALTYDGTTHAVMMASPADLADFARGFSLTEGIVNEIAEIIDIEVAVVPGGIDLRMRLAGGASDKMSVRRRRYRGPAGCGMCGIETLAEANRPVPVVTPGGSVTPEMISMAMAALPLAQKLNLQTRSVHAAAFWQSDQPLLLREDVGRHNALDKLAGALALAKCPASAGILVLSSRISVEMVQKAAMIGAGIVVAVSAPTVLAVRVAEQAGITLIGIARDDGFEVFTGAQLVAPEARPTAVGHAGN